MYAIKLFYLKTIAENLKMGFKIGYSDTAKRNQLNLSI